MHAQRLSILLALAIGMAMPACTEDPAPTGATRPDVADPALKNQVEFDTSMGRFVVELYPDDSPVTVTNFLRYTDQGFYDGLIFHRVLQGFVVQGGAYTSDLTLRPPDDPIVNEAGNGLKNVRGTIAMARGIQVDSAASQFFINLVDNPFLDHKNDTQNGYGYAVFGAVVEGMDVVDQISAVATANQDGFSDVPVIPIEIYTVRRSIPRRPDFPFRG